MRKDDPHATRESKRSDTLTGCWSYSSKNADIALELLDGVVQLSSLGLSLPDLLLGLLDLLACSLNLSRRFSGDLSLLCLQSSNLGLEIFRLVLEKQDLGGKGQGLCRQIRKGFLKPRSDFSLSFARPLRTCWHKYVP